MQLRSATLALTLSLAAAGAWAGPKCDAPKEKWMKEGDFRAMVQKQGYEIKKFKVSSGNCYEIYGVDKDGKKVEIYFDPASGNPVERK